jgi:CHASE3 domain sensor protein
MPLRLPGRLRLPAFLPAYAVLALVAAYAVASLWLGLARLDAVLRFVESGAHAATTMDELASLRTAIGDIETGSRGFALTADASYLESFERGRRAVPPLLAQLRDRLREQTADLAAVEALVPLIAEQTVISAAAIEKKRTTPDQPYDAEFARRGKDSSDRIRAIVGALATREQEALTRDRQMLDAKVRDARRDIYLMAALTLLLAAALLLAVRRIRAFVPGPRGPLTAGTVDVGAAAPTRPPDAVAGTLLRDALLRLRLAAAADPMGDPRRQTLVATLEQAAAEADAVAVAEGAPRRDERDLAAAIAALVQPYAQPDGVRFRTTIDRDCRVEDPQVAFLVVRAIEWALEAIALRKRRGEIRLQVAASGGVVRVRAVAIADHPDLRATLTPREREEAYALSQGLAARGGTLVATEGPTGFELTVEVPAAV